MTDNGLIAERLRSRPVIFVCRRRAIRIGGQASIRPVSLIAVCRINSVVPIGAMNDGLMSIGLLIASRTVGHIALGRVGARACAERLRYGGS
jgi:hypothetical protein